MSETRALSPSEILKFVHPARALVRAQNALHDAQITMRFFHSKDMEEVQLLAEAEATVARLADLWSVLAKNVIARAKAALEQPHDELPVPSPDDRFASPADGLGHDDKA